MFDEVCLISPLSSLLSRSFRSFSSILVSASCSMLLFLIRLGLLSPGSSALPLRSIPFLMAQRFVFSYRMCELGDKLSGTIYLTVSRPGDYIIEVRLPSPTFLPFLILKLQRVESQTFEIGEEISGQLSVNSLDKHVYTLPNLDGEFTLLRFATPQVLSSLPHYLPCLPLTEIGWQYCHGYGHET